MSEFKALEDREWLHVEAPDPGAPVDVGPLREVLDHYGPEPSDSIAVTGELLQDVAATLPYAGRHPYFAGPYGHLSTRIGQAIHHRDKPGLSHLPKFNQAEELEHVAGGFAKLYVDEVTHMVEYYEADSAEERQSIYEQMPYNWQTHLFEPAIDHTTPAGPNPLVEQAGPVAQIGDGYAKHVVGHDLGWNTYAHKVTDDYMNRRTGDFYEPVDTSIKLASLELGPQLMRYTDANPRSIAWMMPAIARGIALMRHNIAVPNYEKLKDAESDEEHEMLCAAMDERSVAFGNVLLRHTGLALDTYEFFTGKGRLWETIRRGAGRKAVAASTASLATAKNEAA